MKDFFRIDMNYSEYHTVFPRLIIYFLILLGILLIIKQVIHKIKAKKLIQQDKSDVQQGKESSIEKKFNIVMFSGSIVLLVAYGFALEWFGFIYPTVLFIILSTLLYKASTNKSSVFISVVNAISTTVLIYFIFGTLFDITLP